MKSALNTPAHQNSGPAKDPVCGMDVDRQTAVHRARHESREFYFCGSGCLNKFQADPGRYLVATAPAPPVAQDGAVYTCPMHPEIRRAGAGDGGHGYGA